MLQCTDGTCSGSIGLYQVTIAQPRQFVQSDFTQQDPLSTLAIKQQVPVPSFSKRFNRGAQLALSIQLCFEEAENPLPGSWGFPEAGVQAPGGNGPSSADGEEAD